MAEQSELLRSQIIGQTAKPALLITDASIAFTDPASPLGANYDMQIHQIASLIAHARTQNWPVLFSTVAYDNDDQGKVFRKKLPDLNILQVGSEWIEIDPRLGDVPPSDLFRKWHVSFFHQTSLNERLCEAAVTSLYVTGFTTSGCVRATAVDGLQYGYHTSLVVDAVGDRNASAHNANLLDFNQKYGDLVTADTVRQHKTAS